jgi:hypothetical protein
MRRSRRWPCGVSARPVLPPTPFHIGSIVSVMILEFTVIRLSNDWLCTEVLNIRMKIEKAVMTFNIDRCGRFDVQLS